MRRIVATTLAALAVTATLAACSGSDDDSGKSTSTSSSPASPSLDILVTNDDGYSAPGIDALVSRLRKFPNVRITVVAPATNQSGTSDRTTPGPVSSLTATKVKTASGYPATAVVGYPADSVNYALDVLKLTPDVVVSGSNAGQNMGVVAPASGTVGAARTAVRRGYPAVAVSQGLGNPADYSPSVGVAATWLHANRAALGGSVDRNDLLQVVNINAPECAKTRGPVTEPLSTTGTGLGTVDCTSTAAAGPDDTTSFLNGFATITFLTTDTQTVTSTTSWPQG